MSDKDLAFCQKLFDKSVEAFLLAVETYNKPTIKYRVEAFAIFICNAWELLLKAHLLQTNGPGAIYYQTIHPEAIVLNYASEKF